MQINRRHFCLGLSALAGSSAFALPRLALASAAGEKRLMLVILRGGMDGLAAVAPVGDRNYHDARGKLALPDSALLNLNSDFAMHHALKPLHTLYQKGEVAVLHAAATPYRNRSHFDAQDLLENGSHKPHGISSGWLGRALSTLGSAEGMAIGSNVPLVMMGASKVQSWAPSVLPDINEDFLSRVTHMYQSDALLSPALASATEVPDTAMGVKGRGPGQFVGMMKVAADFMRKPDGARIGSIDLSGWDTHANQGAGEGKLSRLFSILAQGITTYRAEMGVAWKQTAVLVVTEFGRTVAANGSGGSDHGMAGVCFLVGGSVAGGRVLGDWPGLAAKNLYEERDLYPANDMRGLFKGVLASHMGIDEYTLSTTVFPDSASVSATQGLFA